MLDLCSTIDSNVTRAPAALAQPPALAQPVALAQPPARPHPTLELANPLLRQLLDIFNTGVVLVDDRTQVLHANPAALTLCHAGAALALDSGQLQMSLVQRQRLDAALCAALRGQWSMLVLRQRGNPMAVSVVPMDGDAGCPTLAAALLIGGDGRPSRLALQFFSQNHALTSAEAAVLSALCDGLTPAQIAVRGGVAVCTVRSQISAVRQKTNAGSIGHLLRMVSGLPPVARQTSAQRL